MGALAAAGSGILSAQSGTSPVPASQEPLSDSWKDVKLIALDVGGTILEDHGDVVETLRSTLGERGITVTPEEIAPWRGAAKRAVIQHFVDQNAAGQHSASAATRQNADARKKLVDQIYAQFVARINKAYETVPAIAGADQAIRELRDRNYLLAATTGFDEAIVRPIFRRLGWEKYFAAVVPSDAVAQGRPAPYMLFHAMEKAGIANVAQVLAVGDTVLDLQAAANGGIRCVGVLSGAGTEDQLKKQPHVAILPSVAALIEWLGKRS
jgi:phosphonatase-like hydrolase